MTDKLPKLRIDRTCIRVVEDFDNAEDIEFWRNTSYEERLEHAYRLRYMFYGDKIRGRISRVIEVIEPK
jgi:hypothetical protein